MAIKASFKGLFFMISATLIILKMIFFFVTSISSTSKLLMMTHDHDDHHFELIPPFDEQSYEVFNPPISILSQYDDVVRVLQDETPPSKAEADDEVRVQDEDGSGSHKGGGEMANTGHEGGQRSKVEPLNAKEIYHEKDIFMENYKQMNKTLKIYIYPHTKTDPFANVFLPDDHGSPGGNYASESYFKIALSMSHFVTQDPYQADLFFMPFSIASMRHDKRIGVGGIKNFIKAYIFNISHNYMFWNRTGGADHFYVACHSIGRTAMEKAPQVSINAIQVVCSSSYFLQGYTAHKDASIPQIWPRSGVRPTRHPSKRFYIGKITKIDI